MSMHISTIGNLSKLLYFLAFLVLLQTCAPSTNVERERWDLSSNDGPSSLIVEDELGQRRLFLKSLPLGSVQLEALEVSDSTIIGSYVKWDEEVQVKARIKGDSILGSFKYEDEEVVFNGIKFQEDYQRIDRSKIEYLIGNEDLSAYEADIDHALLISELNREKYVRGKRIYNNNCINCHGTPDIEGSIPLSLKFWSESFKAGSDPYSMYETISKGFGSMPPQITLTPQEKYDVITYIREEYMRESNPDEFYNFGEEYLASLPKGKQRGPDVKPYHPWKDMNYGNFFINTYELVDSARGIERYHSPGPSPFPDEDYSKNNFAYKGIAVRLDEGKGGVSKGKAFMIFDHDLMRIAGGWTGEGFIDWKAILLNDEHETYPRTLGRLHFELPVGPGWANPETGSFEDPRYTARDGRQFGPLPRPWADYKGLYHSGDHIVISYSVGNSEILEELGIEGEGGELAFSRSFNFTASDKILESRIAPIGTNVSLSGDGELKEEAGFVLLSLPKGKAGKVKVFIGGENSSKKAIDNKAQFSTADDLLEFTKGGEEHYPEIINSTITKRAAKGAFAIDELTPPFENPWNCRMKLSGIDFLSDANQAVACATDGDIWLISGLLDKGGELSWKRIGSGLFQPLGIKVINEEIFVTCRDQLVRLQDLNGDGETDFYESFNHDHQVTDHFHEFAMGLQADKEGNLYYAKSGRHAREALIPQHGTLIKVDKDGEDSRIIATGFRAANGVCINPDGSFIVTDQQGYWNPMNRINWVEVEGGPKFYGNMWGYNPPKDSSRAAMEQPLTWVDMKFDRSPSELVWVDSEAWGPLNGSLLSLSYGYGKIQLVLQEKVGKYRQGGVIDLPGIKFMTGVMRGRFNPVDGQLYACGMSAWGTSQLMKGGGLYRIRYTGEALEVPIDLSVKRNSLNLTFAQKLDLEETSKPQNFEIEMWDLKRSKKYGSDRHNIRTLEVEEVLAGEDGFSVTLMVSEVLPVDVMTIKYKVKDVEGNILEGTLQNTIHQVGREVL